MGTVRGILGDVEVAGLGACAAHEHLALGGDFIARRFADFQLDDPAVIAADLASFVAAGGGWAVDTMPTGPGRQVGWLVDIARRSGVVILCPTGLHLPLYYPAHHPLLAMDRDALERLFVTEIEDGLPLADGRRSSHRAGIIKVAGSRDRLTAREREAFAAAGAAARRTGVPIITHTEQGTAGLEQVERLRAAGAEPAHIVLSHCDRVHDLGYHRELLATGVVLEYDNHFRSLDGERCPTAELIAALAPEFPDQIVVGMDLARRRYWSGFGGGPGIAWLLTTLPDILRRHGVADELVERILIHNPARAYALARDPASLSTGHEERP